jgi:hypothetical protein
MASGILCREVDFYTAKVFRIPVAEELGPISLHRSSGTL